MVLIKFFALGTYEALGNNADGRKYKRVLSEWPKPICVEDSNAFMTHKMFGDTEFEFTIERSNPMANLIKEECVLIPTGFSGYDDFGQMLNPSRDEQRFVVKNIDKHSNFITVKCELKLDEWKKPILLNYSKRGNLYEVMSSIDAETGYRFINPDEESTDVRKIEESQGKPFKAATPWEILLKVAEVFEVGFRFDTNLKHYIVFQKNDINREGIFFASRLNLNEVSYVGDSSNFVTRVYAYGKVKSDSTTEGTTQTVDITSVNNGLPYVEDRSYVDKIISGYISDERYTNPQALKEYAEKVLQENCKPKKTYECDIINVLADGTFATLRDLITVIDEQDNTKEQYICVEHKEYLNHTKDVLTLSSLSSVAFRKEPQYNVTKNVSVGTKDVYYNGTSMLKPQQILNNKFIVGNTWDDGVCITIYKVGFVCYCTVRGHTPAGMSGKHMIKIDEEYRPLQQVRVVCFNQDGKKVLCSAETNGDVGIYATLDQITNNTNMYGQFSWICGTQ